MAARLKAAGIPDADLHLFTAPDHPKEGGLVAVYPGREPKAKAVLMLAHLDVVEAKREDWTRDPFTLVEENGNFYAQGASDDKAMVATWVDTLARYSREGFKPRRTLKMALTCGEETSGTFNVAEYLAKNKRDLIDAAFAVDEGGGGLLDDKGKPVFGRIQVGEKLSQNYTFRGEQSRWSLLPALVRQRHLSPGPCPHPGVGLPLSGHLQRNNPRLLHQVRQTPNARAAGRDPGPPEEPQ